jgi:hypothetical protein
MRRSPYSRVVALSLNLNGGTVWLSNTSVGYNLVRCHPAVATMRADRRRPPADLRQSPRPIALATGDDNVDVSGHKLF